MCIEILARSLLSGNDGDLLGVGFLWWLRRRVYGVHFAFSPYFDYFFLSRSILPTLSLKSITTNGIVECGPS
jgi:hypothetical protein